MNELMTEKQYNASLSTIEAVDDSKSCGSLDHLLQGENSPPSEDVPTLIETESDEELMKLASEAIL